MDLGNLFHVGKSMDPSGETFNLSLLCFHLANLIIEEPDAGQPLVRDCGGAGRQRSALPGRQILVLSDKL